MPPDSRKDNDNNTSAHVDTPPHSPTGIGGGTSNAAADRQLKHKEHPIRRSKITETHDGRFDIAFAGETLRISYNEAFALKEKIQSEILRVPRTTRESIRKHWLAIKANGYKQKLDDRIALFAIVRLIDSDEREIVYDSRNPKRQILIDKAMYIAQLDEREQTGARAFWDRFL